MIAKSTEFNHKKLYQSMHGITGVSDPNWSALAGYYYSCSSRLVNILSAIAGHQPNALAP